MIHRIDLAKDTCIYAAARRLLADGVISHSDTIEAWRGDTLCLTGVAGQLAEWTIEERKDGRPSLQLRRYRAFPDVR